MRALLVAAVVLVAALAGCSGKKGGHDHIEVECTDGKIISEEDYEGVLGDNATTEDIEDFLKTKCKVTGSGSGSKSGTASLAPNKLPVLVLNVTDTGGNATNVTMLKGNLTFDATGSYDPDGQISAIAISVQDSNQSRTKQLYDAATKKFSPATFSFDRAGIVNVTIAMVDDRAGFNNTLTKAFVNHPQTVTGADINGPPATGVPADDDFAHSCLGARGALDDGHTIVDAAYYTEISLVTAVGVSFIEVFPHEDLLVTICAPDGTPISEERSDAQPTLSNNVDRLPAPPATQGYYLGFYATAQGVAAGADVVIHYEPKPAAPAA